MFANKRVVCALCAMFVSLMSCVQTAKAQAMEAVSHVYSIGGWDLVEMKDTTGEVMGFWGIPRVAVEVGNIRRLWFESIPSNEWNVWAFEPVAVYSKITDLKVDGASDTSIDFLLYQEFIAADSAVNQAINGGVSGLVVKGFINGDPLTEAVGALSDPDPMIDLLAVVGYPIAPGMSELLVNGTAGVNVNMNPTTKQTLDCLQSPDSVCNDCICTKTEGPVVVDDWTIIETPINNNSIRCTYTRMEHHSYWKTGEEPDENCADCTAGSPENPIQYDILVEIIVDWADVEHCPDYPY